MPDATLGFEIGNPDGRFHFSGIPNDKGFLGSIQSEPFDANSYEDAELKAHRAIAPTLSNWSVHLDIPLYVHHIRTIELRTRGNHVSFVLPFFELPIAVEGEPEFNPEFRHYASFYREALNTSSPLYRFLCLYKIIEGLRARRNRLPVEAKKHGKSVQQASERVPNDSNSFIPWLRTLFTIRKTWDPLALEAIFRPEAIGRKFGHIINSMLNPLRNEIAHLVLETGEVTIEVDEPSQVARVRKWLPLTRCIVRQMLKSDFPDFFLR